LLKKYVVSPRARLVEKNSGYSKITRNQYFLLLLERKKFNKNCSLGTFTFSVKFVVEVGKAKLTSD